MSENDGFLVGDDVTASWHTHGMKGRVMALAEGYAMVRYKGCVPFVAPVKELTRVVPDYLENDCGPQIGGQPRMVECPQCPGRVTCARCKTVRATTAGPGSK